MRTKHLAVTIIPVVLLCLVLSHLLLRAQQPLPPHPDFVDALWVARSNGISKVSTSNASVLFEMADTQNARALAVDEPRGLLWAYRHNTLAAYGFDGKPAIHVPLGEHGDKGNGKEVALSVHPENSTVWLGVKKTLYHFSAQGEWLNIHTLPGDVRTLSWDAMTACLWIGTKESVIALDERGAMCHMLDLGSHPDVQDLTVDPTSGDVWVALKKSVRRYDASRTLAFELNLEKVASLGTDYQGGVWLATDNELMRMDRFGTVRFAIMPFKGHEKIVALVADPADASVWVASKNRVSHISADGRPVDQIEFTGEIRDLAFYTDRLPPRLTVTEPRDGTALPTNTPAIALEYGDGGVGVDVATLHLQANDLELAVACQYDDVGSTCTPTNRLPEGLVTLTAQIQDYAGNTAEAEAVRVTVDTIPPVITLTIPTDGSVTNQAAQSFAGYLNEAVVLTLHGTNVHVGADLSFNHGPLALHEGLNTVELIATDTVGNSSQRHVRVTLDTTPPAAVDQGQLQVSDIADGHVQVNGPVESVEPGASVTITNIRTGQAVTVTAGVDGSFTATLAAQPGDQLTIVIADAAGNVSPETQVPVGNPLPPDPRTVAPPLDRTVATDLASATAFLYTGNTPIQTGVAPGTIEPRRVAVLRGQVKTREEAPLPGVTLTVLGHPAYGQTLTRADGLFDLAVNGGGLLTVRYEKDGFMPVQRQVEAPWRDYAWLPDVVLLPYDDRVTPIDLTASTAIQVARGRVVADERGTRQATLLVAPGTQATMVLPDGHSQPLSTLHVRATEYTVGPNGPAAMPGALPPASAYTYAVELSVDEAVAAGATTVQFSQPVYVYVENFLNFPVGEIVPAGYYDRQRGVWVASDNGRVIQMVSTVDGLAAVDSTGDGAPDDPSTLAALGMTEAEQQRLGLLYQPGQQLWRVPIPHFTPWDCNWPYNPPDDAQASQQPAPQSHEPLPDPTCQGGSIIECQNQTLGEVVGLTGSSLSLHYRSDRVLGRGDASLLTIPLSGATVPASLKRIDLAIEVAGRRYTQSFPAAPSQQTTFVWDGQDAYGRPVQGAQPVTIQIGYVYDAFYREPAQVARSFGAFSASLITRSRTGQEMTLWQLQESTIGPWDARAQGLGGWTLRGHHVYDPMSQVLYGGDGGRRSAKALGSVITTVAGNGTLGAGGDGGPATQAQLTTPARIAVAPDGSLYIADLSAYRIRRVGPDGRITTVAGNGSQGDSGDGGPATQAQLVWPLGVAVSLDGSLYIADGDRIRRVGPDGRITTIAGNGTYGNSGDGGPAIQAQLKAPDGIAAGLDGSLYIADGNSNRIRRVGPDGRITTIAGNGTYGYSGDGGPATRAQLRSPKAVAVGADGSLYIADAGNYRIRRVGPDGRITTVAGTGRWGYSGDGGLAIHARLDWATAVAVAADGSLYIADAGNYRIRRVGPDGRITTVAGNGIDGYSGDGGPATQARLGLPSGVAVHPDGSLYIADTGNYRIRRVELPLAGFSLDDFVIPSGDGGEVYVFDHHGRHLRTQHALTGALHDEFRYDSAGHLVHIVDGDGQTTTIERDRNGQPTAIVAPFGQRTTLTLDPQGYLASLTNPAGDTTQLTYTADGLLTRMTNPNGHQYRFSYDPLGRLIRDEDPVGGFKALTRTETTDAFTVRLTSAAGRAHTYTVEHSPTGSTRRVNTDPDGLYGVTAIGTDGRRRTTTPDGMVTTLTQGPDPRFGMQASITQALSVTTPSGLTATVSEARTVTLANPQDLLSLSRATTTLSLNGRTSTSTFDAAARTLTSRTPAGRQRVSLLDAQGRAVEAQVPGLEPQRFTYDALGRLGTVAHGSRTSAFSYDGGGNVASLTDPLGRRVRFEYDLAGRVTRQILPDAREILYSYDANGNLTSITPPGRPSHAFTYTAVDLEADYLPPELEAGPTPTQYAYNLDRQLVQVTRPDGGTIDLGYDDAGRLSMLTFPRGQLGFGYHPSTGNLATITAPDGGIVTYGYDGRLLTSETWSGSIAGSVQYTYDNNFRPTAQRVNGELLATFQYDADGLLTQAGGLTLSRHPQHGLLTASTLGNVADARTHTRFGDLETYRATFSGTDMFAVQYGRDALGRILQKTETLEGQTTIETYAYDLAGRLTGVQRNGSPVATYAYDSNGNRVSYARPDGAITGTYDAQDRLTQYGASTYTYTTNGELRSKTTGDQTTTYTYDALGNLTAVTVPDSTLIEYVIDGRNRRIGKKVNGTLVQGFLYSGQLTPVAELDGQGNITARFIYGTRANVPDYLIKGGQTYRVITDHLGSPRLVIDTTTGHIVQRMAYDPFGRVTFDDNPGFQPFGFAGGLYDPDTKLTRFGARDYDAETGRWTAKDPIRFAGGDTNLYGYVLNDPVNWVDPDGLAWTDWQENILATLEGTVEESPILNPKTSYGKNTNTDLFVALPDENLKGKRVELEVNGKTVTVEVGDIGPWNGGHMRSGKSLNDPYWDDNRRPQAECGTDLRGRKTNKAGIDISAALTKQLRLKGNTRLRWRGLP